MFDSISIVVGKGMLKKVSTVKRKNIQQSRPPFPHTPYSLLVLFQSCLVLQSNATLDLA